jgi:hypothetical protein
MPDISIKREAAPLNRTERSVAAIAGLVLLAVALAIVITPPQRRVALSQCQNAAAGCIVSVDSDLATFASVLVAAGAAAVLLALLGIRFNRVKVAGTEFTYDKETEGLTRAAPAADGEVNPSVPAVKESPDVPVKVRCGKAWAKFCMRCRWQSPSLQDLCAKWIRRFFATTNRRVRRASIPTS